MTINTFANTDRMPTGRVKKSASSGTTDPPEDWFDKDEEDIAGEIDTLKLDAGCCGSKTEIASNKFESVSNQEGNVYSLDFWDMLGNFVKPEQVAVFGSICRSSYQVINSQGFWRRLFKRYYNPDAKIPARLQPECMERPQGLRACVIRMLHMTYPLYRNEGERASVWADPHKLVGGVCDVSWINKLGRHQSMFYFKIREQTRKKESNALRLIRESYYDNEGDDEHEKLLEHLSNINYNPESGCRVLQVHLTCCTTIPPVLGLRLHQVSLSVSHGMRYHKLKLRFGSPRSDGQGPPDQQDTVQIVLDNVVNLRIMDWWHPDYPHDLQLATSSKRGGQTPRDPFDA